MTDRLWSLERYSADASTLHELPLPDLATRRIWWLEPTVPALVLGSTQREATLPAGGTGMVSVCRRRSGGGAVLLVPGDVLWVDVLLPREDPLWQDDIGRSTWWLGDLWARALEALGFGTLEVWRGGLVRTQWSSAACFAGLGPGEVSISGRKVIGISQRRTRTQARFQCAVLLHYDSEALGGLLGLSSEGRAAVASTAVGLRDLGAVRESGCGMLGANTATPLEAAAVFGAFLTVLRQIDGSV